MTSSNANFKCAPFLVLLILSLSACKSQPTFPEIGPQYPSSALEIMTFVAHNTTTHILGNITIAGSGSTASLYLDSNAYDSTEISFLPGSVTINSQLCLYPNPTIVTLGPTTKVEVDWTSPSVIAVLDYQEMNRPVTNSNTKFQSGAIAVNGSKAYQ